MNKQPAIEKPLTAAQQMDRVWILATAVFVAAFLAVFAYAFTFRSLRFGDPAAWGQFGDYFGGLLNPIIGMATVILVIITLATTLREAAAQRKQFQLQLDEVKRQQVLTEQQKPLEGVLRNWDSLMQTTLTVTRGDEAGLLSMLHGRKLGDGLFDPHTYTVATFKEPGDSPPEPHTTYNMLIPVFELLEEFAEYTKAYDGLSQSHALTNYYRRRVYAAAFVLQRFELITANVLDELTPRE